MVKRVLPFKDNSFRTIEIIRILGTFMSFASLFICSLMSEKKSCVCQKDFIFYS